MNTFRNLFLGVAVFSGAIVHAERDLQESLSAKKEKIVAEVLSKEAVKIGFLSRVGGRVASCVDKVADKMLINSVIKKFAQLSFCPNRVSNFLINHEKGLSRFIVVAVVGSTIYFAWKKYKQSTQKINESRSQDSSQEENYDDWNVLFDGDDADDAEEVGIADEGIAGEGVDFNKKEVSSVEEKNENAENHQSSAEVDQSSAEHEEQEDFGDGN